MLNVFRAAHDESAARMRQLAEELDKAIKFGMFNQQKLDLLRKQAEEAWSVKSSEMDALKKRHDDDEHEKGAMAVKIQELNNSNTEMANLITTMRNYGLQYEEKMKKDEDTIKQLQLKLTDIDNERLRRMNELISRNSEYSKAFGEFQAATSLKDQRIRELEGIIAQQKQTTASSQESLTKELAVLKKDNEVKIQEIVKYSGDHDKYEGAAIALKESMSGLEEEKARLMKEIAILKTKGDGEIATLKDQIRRSAEERAKELEELKKTYLKESYKLIEDRDITVKERNNKIDMLKKELDKLSNGKADEIEKLVKERDAYKAAIETHGSKDVDTGQRFTKLITKLEGLLGSTSLEPLKRQKLSEVQFDVLGSAIEDTLSKSKAKFGEYEGEIVKLRTHLGETEKEKTALSAEKEKIKGTLSNQLNETKRITGEYESRIKNLADEAQNIKSQLAQKDREHMGASQRAVNLEAQLVDILKKKDSLEDEKKSFEAKFMETDARARGLDDQMKIVLSEAEMLKKTLSEKEQFFNKFSGESEENRERYTANFANLSNFIVQMYKEIVGVDMSIREIDRDRGKMIREKMTELREAAALVPQMRSFYNGIYNGLRQTLPDFVKGVENLSAEEQSKKIVENVQTIFMRYQMSMASLQEHESGQKAHIMRMKDWFKSVSTPETYTKKLVDNINDSDFLSMDDSALNQIAVNNFENMKSFGLTTDADWGNFRKNFMKATDDRKKNLLAAVDPKVSDFLARLGVLENKDLLTKIATDYGDDSPPEADQLVEKMDPEAMHHFVATSIVNLDKLSDFDHDFLGNLLVNVLSSEAMNLKYYTFFDGELKLPHDIADMVVEGKRGNVVTRPRDMLRSLFVSELFKLENANYILQDSLSFRVMANQWLEKNGMKADQPTQFFNDLRNAAFVTQRRMWDQGMDDEVFSDEPTEPTTENQAYHTMIMGEAMRMGNSYGKGKNLSEQDQILLNGKIAILLKNGENDPNLNIIREELKDVFKNDAKLVVDASKKLLSSNARDIKKMSSKDANDAVEAVSRLVELAASVSPKGIILTDGKKNVPVTFQMKPRVRSIIRQNLYRETSVSVMAA